MVREMHGVQLDNEQVTLIERAQVIEIKAGFSAKLTPAEARYLARKLYRLAHKIEARNNPTPTNEADTCPVMGELRREDNA